MWVELWVDRLGLDGDGLWDGIEGLIGGLDWIELCIICLVLGFLDFLCDFLFNDFVYVKIYFLNFFGLLLLGLIFNVFSVCVKLFNLFWVSLVMMINNIKYKIMK